MRLPTASAADQAAPVPLPERCYADEAVWFFNKPPDQPIVASGLPGAKAKYAEPALLQAVRAESGEQVSAFYRLEAEVSGLAGFARTKPGLDYLSGQFQGKTVTGAFDALVVVATPEETAGGVVAPWRDDAGGVPDAGELTWPVDADPTQPGRLQVFKRRGGRPAETTVDVRERFGRFAWVRCWPTSGRSAQARAHLAAAGLPVLNDATYGLADAPLLLSGLKRGYKGKSEERPLVTFMALHLAELTLRHPATREPFTVTADAPAALGIALKYLRRFAAGRSAR